MPNRLDLMEIFDDVLHWSKVVKDVGALIADASAKKDNHIINSYGESLGCVVDHFATQINSRVDDSYKAMLQLRRDIEEKASAQKQAAQRH